MKKKLVLLSALLGLSIGGVAQAAHDLERRPPIHDMERPVHDLENVVIGASDNIVIAPSDGICSETGSLTAAIACTVLTTISIR